MASRISVIIPHWPKIPGKHNALLKTCVESLKNQHNELIIVENDGAGFARSVNRGLSVATGDYLMVVNNDVWLHRGNLRDLCVKEAVTSPVVENKHQRFWGCFFCVPREVYEKVGALDEQFEVGTYEDDDFAIRVERAGFDLKHIDTVFIEGSSGATINDIDGMNDIENRNKERFIAKWGSHPKSLISYKV